MKRFVLFSVLIFSIHVCFCIHDTTHLQIFHQFPDSLSVKNTPKTNNKIGWEISGNFGMYKANKHHAQFYNGKPNNVNNINYVLSNYYWRQEIIDNMNYYAQRDSFIIYEYPSNIQYDLSMYVGFSGRYNFSEELALNFSFNFTKLRTRDMFTLQVFPPYSGMVESFLEGEIYGVEGRTNIDVGFLYTFNPEKQTTAFAEMGLTVNSTHAQKNFIRLFDREYNLVNVFGSSSYVPNAQLNQYDIRQGGIGFGTYASGGVRYVMSPQFSMELAGIVYLKTVNLENYNRNFGLHGSVLIRMVMSPLFQFNAYDDEDIY